MGAKTDYRLGSLFWLVIGTYIAIHAYILGLGRVNQPGPGLIFFLAALVLIVLSAVDLAGTFVGRFQKDADIQKSPLWAGLRWRKIILVLSGLWAYALFFDLLGFILSTFLLMVFLYKAVEPTKWWIAIGGGLVTVILSYFIFSVWLQVPFPRGGLGF